MSIQIFINREILLALPDSLRLKYIEERCEDELFDILEKPPTLYPEFSMEDVANIIKKVIDSNEDFNTEYGKMQKNGLKQVDETCMVPGFSETSGFYQSGKLLICPSDWSWDEDGNFNYAFQLATFL